MNKLKKALIWCFMLTKRSIKNPVLLISIIMIPILSLALKNSGDEETGIIKVGIVNSCVSQSEEPANVQSDSLAFDITKKLKDSSNSSIRFLMYDDVTSLKKDIYTSKISIGFEFDKNFDDKLMQYANNFNGYGEKASPITCYYLDSKKDSVYNKLATESIYNSIYEYLSKDVTLSFAAKKLDITDEDVKELTDIFNSMETAENFFTFTFLGTEDRVITGKDNSGYLTLPLKGLILALILLSALAGGACIFNDRHNGLFNAIPISYHMVISFVYCLIPAMLTSIFGLMGLILGGVEFVYITDIFRFILFIPLTAIFALLLTYVTKNINLYMGISIIYLLINLLFCPVFVNIQNFIPGGKILRYFLVLHYGL